MQTSLLHADCYIDEETLKARHQITITREQAGTISTFTDTRSTKATYISRTSYTTHREKLVADQQEEYTLVNSSKTKQVDVQRRITTVEVNILTGRKFNDIRKLAR